MGLYRRLADLETSQDLESFAAELIDRFGALPQEVSNLLDIVTIKQLCRTAGVGQVDAGPKGAVIGFHNNAPPKIEALMRWIIEKGGAIKLRPDQKLVVIRAWDSADKRVKGVQSLMRELAALA
jgi:transcription-repair coupling factor (superfamily II helicase)